MTEALSRVARFSVSSGELEAILRPGHTGAAPLVFLHGWTLDRRMWAPQLENLKTHRPLIAVDRRGFGQSTAPPDLQREADDIAGLLNALDADKAVIVGMSQSGRVAVDFALKHPERLSGLILQGARLGPAAQNAADEEIPVEEYAALVRDGRLTEMKKRWRRHVLMRSTNTETNALIDRMLADYQARDLGAVISAPAEFDAQRIAAISVPALIVTGAEDTKHRRAVANELSRIMPAAVRCEIEGAGHMCNLCAADEYNRLVEGFLDRIDDAP